MTSQGYWDWINAGRPFTTAQPIVDLGRTLRGYGYTVYTIGDNSHLQANTPEDHCPFSYTGWPVPSPRWWIHACDIMPPPAGSGLPNLAQLGGQLVADKLAGHAGVAWLKYLNWTRADGQCVHESWEPGHNVRSSSDTGHIHISARSDFTNSAAAVDYDPVARFRQGGGVVTPPVPPSVAPASAPAWPGRYLQYVAGRRLMSGSDVRQWQQRMRDRGWRIGVDGYYGQESAGVCRAFQTEKRLYPVDGIVGPVTWAAAWTSPVT